jgi:hypothetical protein
MITHQMKRIICNGYSLSLLVLLSVLLYSQKDAYGFLWAFLLAILFYLVLLLDRLEKLRPSQFLLLLPSSILTFLVTAIMLIHLEKPSVPLAILITCFSIILLLLLPGRFKIVSIGVSVISVSFGLAEAYLDSNALHCSEELKLKAHSNRTAERSIDPVIQDELLGYKPLPDSIESARRVCGKDLIYDATYTFDEKGQRNTNGSNDGIPLLLFGDSFMFGVGLNDRDTLGSNLEELSSGKYHTYNFAFAGYGPHQTYCILENALEKKVLGDKDPEFGLYFAAFDLERATGRRFETNLLGPMYGIQEDGKLKYQGNLESSRAKRLGFLLEKSILFNQVLEPAFFGHGDQKLFVELIIQSKNLFEQRYGVDYYVILWKSLDRLFEPTILELRGRGLKVFTPAEIFANYEEDWEKYVIRTDGHPNAVAQKEIAQFLLRQRQH